MISYILLHFNVFYHLCVYGHSVPLTLYCNHNELVRKPTRVNYFNFIGTSLPLHSSIVRSTSIAFFRRTFRLFVLPSIVYAGQPSMSSIAMDGSGTRTSYQSHIPWCTPVGSQYPIRMTRDHYWTSHIIVWDVPGHPFSSYWDIGMARDAGTNDSVRGWCGMSRAVPSGVGTARPIGLSKAMLDIEGCPAFILLMEE